VCEKRGGKYRKRPRKHYLAVMVESDRGGKETPYVGGEKKER